jgi:hypothetical protein
VRQAPRGIVAGIISSQWQLTTVQVERLTGNLPPIQAFDSPALATPVSRIV